MEKRPALGKASSALIPDAPEPRIAPLEVDVDRLSPNDLQPRGNMDHAALERLAQSIASSGIIQPIVVRKVGDRISDHRWRAAMARCEDGRPPARADRRPRRGSRRRAIALLEMALIENIQREDLNAIEEALAYRRLSDQFDMTQEAIAVAVGKDRATVANVLRLLRLPGRSSRRCRGRDAVDGPRARAARVDERSKPAAARTQT